MSPRDEAAVYRAPDRPETADVTMASMKIENPNWKCLAFTWWVGPGNARTIHREGRAHRVREHAWCADGDAHSTRATSSSPQRLQARAEPRVASPGV